MGDTHRTRCQIIHGNFIPSPSFLRGVIKIIKQSYYFRKACTARFFGVGPLARSPRSCNVPRAAITPSLLGSRVEHRKERGFWNKNGGKVGGSLHDNVLVVSSLPRPHFHNFSPRAVRLSSHSPLRTIDLVIQPNHAHSRTNLVSSWKCSGDKEEVLSLLQRSREALHFKRIACRRSLTLSLSLHPRLQPHRIISEISGTGGERG